MRKPWHALTLIDQHRAPEHDHQAPQHAQRTPVIPTTPRDDPAPSDRIADTLQRLVIQITRTDYQPTQRTA